MTPCRKVSDIYTRQITTALECAAANTRDGFRYRDALKTRATVECILFDGRHAVGNHEIGDHLIVQIQIICITQRVGIFIRKSDLAPCRKISDVDTRQIAAALECAAANARDLFRYIDALKTRATVERAVTNACDVIGKGDGCQARATVECTGINARSTCDRNLFEGRRNIGSIIRIRCCAENISKICVIISGRAHKRKRNALKAGATGKCTKVNPCHVIGNSNGRQICTTIECNITNSCTTRDHNRLERGGSIESVIGIGCCTKEMTEIILCRGIRRNSYERHRQALQAITTAESRNADVRYATGNYDLRQSRATVERRRTNAQHAIGDRDACQRGIVIEGHVSDRISLSLIVVRQDQLGFGSVVPNQHPGSFALREHKSVFVNDLIVHNVLNGNAVSNRSKRITFGKRHVRVGHVCLHIADERSKCIGSGGHVGNSCARNVDKALIETNQTANAVSGPTASSQRCINIRVLDGQDSRGILLSNECTEVLSGERTCNGAVNKSCATVIAPNKRCRTATTGHRCIHRNVLEGVHASGICINDTGKGIA